MVDEARGHGTGRAGARPDRKPPRGASEPKAAVRPLKSRRVAHPAPLEASQVDLGYLRGFVSFHLRMAQDASSRALARHRDLVKPGRFPALAIIHLNPGISQSALGRAIARDKSTVSPLIHDLQANGFISRRPSLHDRRSVTLALTKKGERTLTRLHARASEHEDALARLIGPAKGQLVGALETIAAGLDALAADG